jgi:DNA-binding CsgD family transcriptional regulator
MAAARVSEAGGNLELAARLYRRALESWHVLGFRLRAAQTALDLHRVTGGNEHVDRVDVALRLAPNAWFRESAGAVRAPLARLSPNERRVLEGLLDGASPFAIATTLGRNESTVRAAVPRIFTAFGAHSRRELLKRCADGAISASSLRSERTRRATSVA